MDLDSTGRELPKARPSSVRINGSRSSRNDAWSRHKDEIHRFYLLDDNTLPCTMEHFGQSYGLKACTRSWKAKLKEWKFEKYLTDGEKTALVARAEKRKREEGKETVFFHFDRQVNPTTLENFKKRKRGKALEVSSPICQTPEDVSYSTPRLHPYVNTDSDMFEELPQRVALNAQQEFDSNLRCSTNSRSLQVANKRELQGAPLRHSYMYVMQSSTETTTTPLNSEPRMEPDQLPRDDAQTPVGYAANLLRNLVDFNEVKSNEKIADEKASFYYKASLVQSSIVDHNLEFLETAFTDGRVRIKVNGLIAEGISAEPNTLVWSVSRSPINSWCHGCLQIIGSRGRYACSVCPTGDGTMYYCLDCNHKYKGRCLSQDHQLYYDKSLMGWNCKKALSPPIHIRCGIGDCRRCIEGIYFHCCTCINDEFDICLQCVSKGRGCLDLQHTLELAVSPINPLTALAPHRKKSQKVPGLVDEAPWALQSTSDIIESPVGDDFGVII